MLEEMLKKSLAKFGTDDPGTKELQAALNRRNAQTPEAQKKNRILLQTVATKPSTSQTLPSRAEKSPPQAGVRLSTKTQESPSSASTEQRMAQQPSTKQATPSESPPSDDAPKQA